MNIKHGFTAAFAIVVLVICWRDIVECHRLPFPARLIGAGIVFGLLDIFSIVSEELAGVVAFGIVIASLVNKAFKSDCDAQEVGDVQPDSYQVLQQPQVQAM